MGDAIKLIKTPTGVFITVAVVLLLAFMFDCSFSPVTR